jgi:hypothetical protein
VKSVTRSGWNSTVNEPKTRRSRSPIPVVKQLAEALEAHRLRAGILAQPNLPIFQAGNGQPLNLDNLSQRVIAPALSRCAICRKPEDEHKAEAHLFKRDMSLPEWHGWHAFRRGLATNLHALGVDDKTSGDSETQQHRPDHERLREIRERIASECDGHAQ